MNGGGRTPMKRFVTALVSAAAGVGIVLGVHGTRSSPPLAGPGGASHGATAKTHPSSTKVSQGAMRNGAAVGPSERYGYGVLAVKVTERDGRIVNLNVVGLQTSEPFSASIAQRAIPVLRGEVLEAQSANVATVSGATYTSEAYLLSLQAALDRLRS
jgi:uncharacterized protein with FMN-binding domain